MKNEIVFSFAASEVGPLSRAFIKLTELSTGQPKLKRIYSTLPTLFHKPVITNLFANSLEQATAKGPHV